jgi:DoxX-like protein
MKRTKILYWVFTILFAGFMIWSGIPGIAPSTESKQFMHDFLGYPVYFIQFISAAKVLGGLTILIPGFYRIKEWAYAGLFFDLAGAIYSVLAVTKAFDAGILFIFLPVLLGILSYIFWKKLISGTEMESPAQRGPLATGVRMPG